MRKEYKVFIGLKPRSELFVSFSFFNASQTTAINPLNLSARVLAIPQRIGAKAPLARLEVLEDDQEFELLYNKDLRVFYAYMTSGTFLVNVRAKGYLELTKTVTVN